MMKSREELETFIASLRIPESRRELVAVELRDHVESRIEAELVCGAGEREAEQRALESFGDVEKLRASLERVEPGFELSPRDGAARGVASALIAAGVFVAQGALIPRGPILDYDNPLTFALIALSGAAVLWLLAPRGMGAAFAAEARASLQPQTGPRTKRRRAVIAYVWSMLFVAYALAVPIRFIEPLRHLGDDLLRGFGVTWLLFGPWGLYLFARARREKKLIA